MFIDTEIAAVGYCVWYLGGRGNTLVIIRKAPMVSCHKDYTDNTSWFRV